MRFNKARGQVLTLGHNSPMSTAGLGQGLERCPVQKNLEVLLNSG